MRTLGAAVAAISLAALVAASPASGFEGGGRKPSEAPLITVGQRYTGQLNNHENDSNYGGYREVAIWHLPPMTARDVITVDWEAAPYTNRPGSFPVCMVFSQGVSDFNWGTLFGGADCYSLSGSGSAHTEIVAQEPNSTSSYLEFTSRAEETDPSDYETYPYSFTVGPILHYLGLAIKPVKRVNANGVIRATANLASGAPAPDGLPFNLAVTWDGGGSASYTGVSSGGVVAFQLALPETAFGEQATLVVSHPADGTYQGVSSPKAYVKVARPKAPPPSPCVLAERRVLSLARQYRRLVRHARRAHGLSKRILRRRAAQTKRKLRAARRKAIATCT